MDIKKLLLLLSLHYSAITCFNLQEYTPSKETVLKCAGCVVGWMLVKKGLAKGIELLAKYNREIDSIEKICRQQSILKMNCVTS